MRRLVSAVVIPAAAVVAVACIEATTSDEPTVTDMRAKAPAVSRGFQVTFPEKVIDVGADIETCYVPDITFDHDVYITQADAYQGSVGHHVQIYGSAVPRKAGEVFDCSDLSVMSSLLPLVTPNNPLKEKDNKKKLPENFYVKIPAGSRIVMQSHYVNYTDTPILTADTVNFETVDDVTGMTEASFYVLSHNTFSVPEGQSTVTYECDVDADTQLLYAMGHMHERGKSISLERTPAGSEVPEVLYSVDTWTSEYRDDAPTDAYPPSEPLVLNAGDHLKLTCNFDNATGETLPWPKEMCVVFTAYWPARDGGFQLCE